MIMFEVIEPPPSPNLIPLTVRSLLNVLAPANVWVPVVTTPRAVEDASGMFKVITGVLVPVATDEVMSVPVEPTVKAATLVTVPPLPVAVRVPVELRLNPVPIVTSPGAAAEALVLPSNFPAVMF